MAWISLIVAGLGEVFGVAMVNKFHHERKWYALVLISNWIWFKLLIINILHENHFDGNSLCNLDRHWRIRGSYYRNASIRRIKGLAKNVIYFFNHFISYWTKTCLLTWIKLFCSFSTGFESLLIYKNNI